MNNLIKFPYKKPPPPPERTTMRDALEGLFAMGLSFVVVYAATALSIFNLRGNKMSNHDLQETVYKEAFTKHFDERTDAEKVVVWQQHTISGLKDQIKTLQENNLINVDQGIHVRRFSGECDDLTLDSQMPLVESYEILDSTVIDSLQISSEHG